MQSNADALKVEVKLSTKIKETAANYTFLFCGLISVIAILVITVFLVISGVPAIREIGLFKFLLGQTWSRSAGEFGIWPMIVGSVYVTAGALVVGVPLGLFSAAFMTFFCPRGIKKVLKQVINLLVGIPSIIYGFFGIMVILPWTSRLAEVLRIKGGTGEGVLIASVILGIMILPTIINISAASIEAVPRHYYEGAVALGATHEQAVFKVVIPAAKGGIFTSVVLGVGRAIGETMAMVMVVGNAAWIPPSVLHPVRTLTTGIVAEMAYADRDSLHYRALLSIALVLFVFILVLYLSINLYRQRNAKKGI